MDEHAIHHLKQLYELEKFQISYYMSQLSSVDDKFYHKAFSTIIETKNKHANFLAKTLIENGIEVPKAAGTLADIAGNVIGESLEFTGLTNATKIGVSLENKVMTKYYELIQHSTCFPNFQDKLMEFLLDEEFHALWLQNYAKRLQQQKEYDKNTFMVDDAQGHPTINVNMRWP